MIFFQFFSFEETINLLKVVLYSFYFLISVEQSSFNCFPYSADSTTSQWHMVMLAKIHAAITNQCSSRIPGKTGSCHHIPFLRDSHFLLMFDDQHTHQIGSRLRFRIWYGFSPSIFHFFMSINSLYFLFWCCVAGWHEFEGSMSRYQVSVRWYSCKV